MKDLFISTEKTFLIIRELLKNLYKDLRHYFWRRSILKTEAHFIKSAAPKVGNSVTVCRSSINNILELSSYLGKRYMFFDVPYSAGYNPDSDLIEIIRIK